MTPGSEIDYGDCNVPRYLIEGLRTEARDLGLRPRRDLPQLLHRHLVPIYKEMEDLARRLEQYTVLMHKIDRQNGISRFPWHVLWEDQRRLDDASKLLEKQLRAMRKRPIDFEFAVLATDYGVGP